MYKCKCINNTEYILSNELNVPKISVIITGLNRSEDLENLFRSIHNQKVKPYEIIYVDGGSTDNSIEIAKKYGAKVIVDDEANTPAAGRNIGLNASNGNFVLFLDSDCILSAGYMEKCYEIAKDLPQNVAGFGAGYRYLDLIYSETLTKILVEALTCTLVNGGSPQFKLWNKRKFVSRLPGGNSCYRKDILIKVGGFNNKLNYCEEIELGKKLTKQGFTLLYIPELVVFHKPFSTASKMLKKIAVYGYWRGWYFLKEAFSFPHLSILIFIVGVLLNFFIRFSTLLLYMSSAIYILLILINVIIEKRSFKFPLIFCAAVIIHLCYISSFLFGLINRIAHSFMAYVKKFNYTNAILRYIAIKLRKIFIERINNHYINIFITLFNFVNDGIFQ